MLQILVILIRMLCPSCKKEMTSIIKDVFLKKTNTVRRDRYCKCGFLFSTFEKFKIDRSNRKIRPDTYWKRERMYFYGLYRYQAAVDAFEKLLIKNKLPIFRFEGKKGIKHLSFSKQIKSKEDLENIHSRRKKYKFENIKLHYKENKGKALFCVEIDNKKLFHPVESKKETIEKIVLEEEYWSIRGNIMGKNFKDSENKDKVRREVSEYYKSACSYIKNKEFDQKFFIKMSVSEGKLLWKNKQVWDIYSVVR